MQCDCDALQMHNETLEEKIYQYKKNIQSLKDELRKAKQSMNSKISQLNEELRISKEKSSKEETTAKCLEAERMKNIQLKEALEAARAKERLHSRVMESMSHQQNEKKILFSALTTEQRKNAKLQKAKQSCSSNKKTGQREMSQIYHVEENLPCSTLSYHLRPKIKKAIGMTGGKSLVQCNLGGVLTTVLWDSGSEVSVVDMAWMKTHIPEAEIQPLGELHGFSDKFTIVCVNQSKYRPKGWIGVEFSLPHVEGSELILPLLVTETPLEQAMIGVNVMQELAETKRFSKNDMEHIGTWLEERKDLICQNQFLRSQSRTMEEWKKSKTKKFDTLQEPKPRKRKPAIKNHEKADSDEEDVDQAGQSTHQAQVSRKESKIAKLSVTKQPLKCSIGGVQTVAFWDTGATISTVSLDWKNRHLPDVEIRPLEDANSSKEIIYASDKTEVPYEGWLELDFSLPGGAELSVPFLVLTIDVLPLIGTNIIEALSYWNITADRQNKQFEHYLTLVDQRKHLIKENEAIQKECDRLRNSSMLLEDRTTKEDTNKTTKRKAKCSNVDSEGGAKKKRKL